MPGSQSSGNRRSHGSLLGHEPADMIFWRDKNSMHITSVGWSGTTPYAVRAV
jgi:hypothetical protein